MYAAESAAVPSFVLLQSVGADLDSTKVAAERDAANAALSEARSTAVAAQQDAAR